MTLNVQRGRIVVAAAAAIVVTAAFPLTAEGTLSWVVVGVVAMILALFGARMGPREALTHITSAVCIALLARLVMAGLYVSGARLPAFLPELILNHGNGSWAHGGMLMVRGADGMIAMSMDATKAGLWQFSSVALACVVATSRGRRLAPALVAGAQLTALWGLIFVLRFAVLTEWFAGTPDTMVSQEISSLTMFWHPGIDVPLVLLAAVPIAWSVTTRPERVVA